MTRPIVLVHGAWHGGWAWQPVEKRLRQAGWQQILTPTLTGLGERSHLLTRDVDLRTHVTDIVNVLEFEDLHDAVLVAHSYAGAPAVNAAVEAADRVGHLVVVDGFLPARNEAAIDLLPPHAASHYLEAASETGDGWRIPPRPLEALGVTDADATAWLQPRLGPHPLATYQQPSPWGAGDVTAPGTYLLCDGWSTPFGGMADRARDLEWDVVHVDGDHEVLATNPSLLVDTLLDVVSRKVA